MTNKKIILIFLLMFLGLNKAALSQTGKSKRKDADKQKISELIINSTVKIESLGDSIVNGRSKEFLSTSTAFFFEFRIDSLRIPVLVTNFHSIRNTIISKITFVLGDSLNRPIRPGSEEYVNNNFQNQWIKHPKYDLAILPLAPILTTLEIKQHNHIARTFIYAESIPPDSVTSEFSAIEELLMIGYPKGYSDSYNHYAIVRKGTTATPIYSNFDNKREFLLDIPIYSGSSGSPVFLFNENIFPEKGRLINGTRIYFVGIATKSIDYKTLVGSSQTEIDNPLNIAIVIKASELLEFNTILKEMIRAQQNKGLQTKK